MEDFLHSMLTSIAMALAPIITGVIVALAVKVSKKLGVDMNQKQLQMVQDIARDAVAYAAQMAKVQIKTDGSDMPQMSSSDKKKLAMDYANQVAKAHGVSDFAIEMLDGAIEAALPQAPHAT